MPNADAVLTRAIDALAPATTSRTRRRPRSWPEIMAGNASETQIAGVPDRAAHEGRDRRRARGPGGDDARARHAGAARAQRPASTPPGTGGGRPTFNVSTTAALIAAGAGCAVAKHGNRSATEPLGLGRRPRGARRADRPAAPTPSARCIDEVGFGFMFAPAHHPATRYVVPVRKELAVRTIFNFLGPLTNPAGARRQLIGVSDPGYLETIAGALALLGVDRALVVSSEDGLDEMSTSAPTRVVEVNGDEIARYTVTPGDVGLPAAPPDAVAGGTPDDNAATTRAILAGEAGPAARPRAAQRGRGDLRRRARGHPARGRRGRARGDRRRRGDRARSRPTSS